MTVSIAMRTSLYLLFKDLIVVPESSTSEPSAKLSFLRYESDIWLCLWI